jgi:hypothetical protein
MLIYLRTAEMVEDEGEEEADEEENENRKPKRKANGEASGSKAKKVHSLGTSFWTRDLES